MNARWIALAAIALSCKRSAPPPPPEVDPEKITWPAPADASAPAADAEVAQPVYRTEAPALDPRHSGKAQRSMVVAESIEASTVGRDILRRGGNAVDAAVATAFALAVTHPTAGNIGGGGFALVRTAPGKFTALDFRESAPGAATEKMYQDPSKPPDASTLGHLSAGVPGSVAGLYELHQKLGKLPWKDLVEPSIKLARDGFVLDDYLHAAIGRMTEKLAKYWGADLFLDTDSLKLDGQELERTPKAVGTVIKIPDLAITLTRIRDRGPDGFYKGETAAAIVAEMTEGGGLITAEDLAGYKAVWRQPLQFSYRGRSVTSMPPPSSGGLVIAMTAGMLKNVELGKLVWHGPDHLHRLAEVWRRAYYLRNEHLGDPAFAKDMPIAKLMSAELHAKLANTIAPTATVSKAVPSLVEGTHTTNLCVVDQTGMAVALTTTLNSSFGGGVFVKGAGFFLNNEMDDFAAKPGQPNQFGLIQNVANKIEPGKRMLSSMSPTIVEDDKGQLVLVVGAEGGSKIITAVFQTLSNVIDFGKPVALAVAEKRVHHQDFPDLFRIEDGSIDQATAEALSQMGHTLKWGDPPRDFGGVTAIAKTTDGLEGAVDPRRRGAALGD